MKRALFLPALVSADAAAKQCTTLARFRPNCPPTIFPAGI
jgi:hypothetical protein